MRTMKKRIITTLTAFYAAFCFTGMSYASDASPEPPAAALTAVSDAGPADTPSDELMAPAALESALETTSMETPLTAPTNQEETIDIGVEIAKRLNRSEWLPAFGFLLFIFIYAIRRWVVDEVSWFQTKLGVNVLVFGTAVIMSVGTNLIAGNPFSIGLLTTALAVAWNAKGKHGDVKLMKDTKV